MKGNLNLKRPLSDLPDIFMLHNTFMGIFGAVCLAKRNIDTNSFHLLHLNRVPQILKCPVSPFISKCTHALSENKRFQGQLFFCFTKRSKQGGDLYFKWRFLLCNCYHGRLFGFIIKGIRTTFTCVFMFSKKTLKVPSVEQSRKGLFLCISQW